MPDRERARAIGAYNGGQLFSNLLAKQDMPGEGLPELLGAPGLSGERLLTAQQERPGDFVFC